MKKKTLTQVLLEVSVHLSYLYQDKGIRRKEDVLFQTFKSSHLSTFQETCS